MKVNVEIKVEGLHKSFGDHRVLCGVDLEIDRGDFIAIVGGSGCGKTVLLNHILDLLAPDKGRILAADHDRPGAPLTDVSVLDDRELDRLHTLQGELEHELADPQLYTEEKKARLKTILLEKADIDSRCEAMETDWLEVCEQLEVMQARLNQ